ncbi:MAG: CHASE2 domain-containing protein [Neoaquamicrobium sediminum]|uniref:CHASE2 domain-containing protein n=1 Tax=Neoaquamicrobium sediminum TaxID=1849104 RepID=UPI004037D92B
MQRGQWWRQMPQAGRRWASDAKARRRSGLGLVAILVSAIVLSLQLVPAWRLAELRLFDFLTTVDLPAVSDGAPVIVAIDEPSLAEIGLQWPWPRALHARLVESLRAAGASVIGLDIIFAEASSEEQDAALQAAMGPDVVLAGDESWIDTEHARQHVRTEPLQRLVEAGSVVGIATVSLDGDGVVRRIPDFEDGFALMLARSGGVETQAAPPDALMQSSGPARSYPTVSYYQALDPENYLPEGTFDGKIVIIGLSLQAAPTTQQGGADVYQTAHTIRSGRLVPGAEIQATIFDNLVQPRFHRQAGGWLTAALVAGGAFLAVLLVWRGSGWRTLAGVCIFAAAAVAGSWLALQFGRIYIAPLAPMSAFAAIVGVQAARDYGEERRLRRGISRAFSQYVSPVIVSRLAANPGLLKLGGESRVITVLFCDVRGFTSMAETMKDEPERLTGLINRLLNPLSQAVIAEEGTIDKYMGDCVMAFWNAPLDEPRHAARAVAAARRMIVAVEDLNRELAQEEGTHKLGVGIGINTGLCVVGNMGSDFRFDYSVIGDAVNLASRLESLTKDYATPVVIGAATAEQLATEETLIEIDRIAVRGRNQVSPIYTLLDFLGDSGPPSRKEVTGPNDCQARSG